MKISTYSRIHIMEGASQWVVPKEYFEPFYNYLVHGWSPGSCFTSVLANDFFGAIQHSHPANTVEVFKRLTGWINNKWPSMAWGSYEAVKNWVNLSEDQRREYLEAAGLLYTEKQEVDLALRGKLYTVEPVLW